MLFCVHTSSPPSPRLYVGPVWAVRYCGYIQVYVSKPGTCTNQPCIYTAAPFRLQKHGEHSLLWGLGCPTEDAGKKTDGTTMDGWGVGLAPIPAPDWLLSWQRHVWPYLPPCTPLAVRVFYSRPCTFLLLLTLFFSSRAKLFVFCPFLPPPTVILKLWPLPHRAGERVKPDS